MQLWGTTKHKKEKEKLRTLTFGVALGQNLTFC